MGYILTFTDHGGKTVYQGKVVSLPLSEKIIISKSIDLFNDTEPCIIHRTFIMNKIFLEIDDYFSVMLKEKRYRMLWEELPDFIKEVINIPGNIENVVLS